MRILFVDQFGDFGGAQIGLLDLLEETVRQGWKTEVMAPGNGPLHKACADRGIPSSKLPLAHYASGHKTIADVCRYGFDSLRSGMAIRNAARRLQANLIYINGPRVLPAAVVAARSESAPMIFHAHSYLDREYTRRIARWCINRKRMRVLAISRFVARPFASLADSSALRIVYNGVRDHGFVARPRLQPLCIGILGRISHEKGHLDFVRAAKVLAVGRPGLRFAVFGAALFSGDSYERDVRAAARGTPVGFRGWTDDVPAALHEMDVLAVPSGPAEGATRVIMEAFSAGTPVVAYPSGGIPELVSHGETGLLTSANTCEALAETLNRLLNNRALMERLSVHGRREWEARFRLRECQRQICDFIRETITRPAAVYTTGLKATSGSRSKSLAP